ncbi:MAG: hypothetical protein H6867_11390 [Rhodospirillales bacterium]|nr:hypothetical protein [Rhodospirillales bacterium]MCB9996733.1 hypothetical protein [Rhodospirillales bacterium]
MDLKSFDWRSLQKYMNPNAANDLNDFLEKLPQTAGQTALIAAGIAWMAAGALGLYTFIQVQNMTELRAQLKETQALKPLVPALRDIPVPQAEVANFAKGLIATYPNLDIKQTGPSIQIMAKTTSSFGAFREAIGHVQNGGAGWRVSVDKMCVGRECQGNGLGVLLKINKVSVDKPTG